MGTRQKIPAEARQILEEILEALDGADDRTTDEKNDSFVAGYLSAVIRFQASRLGRLLEEDEPPAAEKAKAP